MRLLTTTQAGDREQKMAWWEPRLLGAYWWAEEGGGGRTASREYVFCCPPACRINSWHEHNVGPLCFLALCGKQWNSPGPSTSLLKAALGSDLSQTPCDLTSPIGLGTGYVTWGTRHDVWSHSEKVEGLPLLHWDSQEGVSKVKSDH